MSAIDDLYDYGCEYWQVTRSGVEDDGVVLGQIADVLAEAMAKVSPLLAKLDSPSTDTFDVRGYARQAPAFDAQVAAEIIVEAALDDFLSGPAQAVVLEGLRGGNGDYWMGVVRSTFTPPAVTL